MRNRLSTLALIVEFVGLVSFVSLTTSCNRNRHNPGNYERPGSAVKLVQPQGPAGTPEILAPPRPETSSRDKGEPAGIAAGHTTQEQEDNHQKR
jgi:hypothetical protein